MATDLETRKTTSKSEAFLQRKFAELCARVRRTDLAACLLTLPLAVLGYALVMGLFDRFVTSSDPWVLIVRWAAYAGFVGTLLFLLIRAVRCAFRPVNPYYVAHQLEGTLPDAKNSLINWLDLHEQDLPAAFRKNLSTSAAEQLQESDLAQPIATRRNRILLGCLAPEALGLIVLLILGPAAFAASMMRAFLPFLDMNEPRTRITLVQPAGNIDVTPGQSVTFTAKIEGRAGAPKLLYRYQPGEDFLSQPLSAEAGGSFTTQLLSTQLCTGFSYKITAGDAATDEYQVRVRARAHVEQFAVTYLYRPYRKLPKTTATFPNQHATAPLIHGQRGTEVEMVIRASQPAQKASVEIIPRAEPDAQARGAPTLPALRTQIDGRKFSCRLTLEQSAQFRVVFTSVDGEENIDRELYPIEVVDDEAPRVVLTLPGKDVSLPANGTLELAGTATDDFGLKRLALHLRIVNGPKIALMPRVYRAGKSFQKPDGTYPEEIEYQDFIALNELKDAKGIPNELPAGTVLEYWLEATDNADYPSAAGNVGKSSVYKLTLLGHIKDTNQQQVQRQRAKDAQARHEKKQDTDLAKPNQQRNDTGGASGDDPQKTPDEIKNDKKDNDTKQKIEKTLNEKKDQKDGSGGGGQGEKKPSPPQGSPDGPTPQDKDQKPMSPDDAGNNKGQGGDPGASGESRDGGPMDQQDAASKGDSKDGGPKELSEPAKDRGPMGQAEPAGGAKDGGLMDANAPPMGESKDHALDAPMPRAKGDDSGPANAPGSAKTESSADQPKKDGAPNLERVAKLVEKLGQGDAEKEEAAGALADIGRQSNDEATRELAKEILDKNGRDPGTGKEKKKAPNRFGTDGRSDGISDDVKAAAANREFARRIGQMQLDDWKKRLTPELLKKAGVSEADWQRYVRNQQAYDALVRQLNAKQAMAALRKTTNPRPTPGNAPRLITSPTTSTGPLESGRYQPPPEIRDANFRLSTKK